MRTNSLTGSLRLLFLYDVSESTRLEELQRILGTQIKAKEPSFRGPSPEYVRFQAPPVVEMASPLTLDGGEHLEVRISYFEYGVVSVSFELAFECGWTELVNLAFRWIGSADLERQAEVILQKHLQRITPALSVLYSHRLSEDYGVIYVRQAAPGEQGHPTAAEIISQHGPEIAQMVRGERVPLSPEEEKEILQSRMSYYPDDLVVVGWSAAFIYDSQEGAIPLMQLLEYANSQLLDLRHYDEMLTGVLAGVYLRLDRKHGLFERWRLAREAENLHTILLDVEELTERVNNSIKFLSDMFSARFYRLAAAKVGVLDYHQLVDEKLKTAAALYRSMMDQFHQARAFVLEAMVVGILIIDLIFLFSDQF